MRLETSTSRHGSLGLGAEEETAKAVRSRLADMPEKR
jgi:hypothetical protein